MSIYVVAFAYIIKNNNNEDRATARGTQDWLKEDALCVIFLIAECATRMIKQITMNGHYARDHL